MTTSFGPYLSRIKNVVFHLALRLGKFQSVIRLFPGLVLGFQYVSTSAFLRLFLGVKCLLACLDISSDGST